MPRRSIYDQTKIVKLMIKWCDNTNSKGMIVCLDQKKAYDRIGLQYCKPASSAVSLFSVLYCEPASAH